MKSRKKVVLIAAAILSIIVIAGIYSFVEPKEVTNYAEFEEDQKKTENGEPDNGVTAGIQIPGYKSIIIPEGTKDVSVELVNPEENAVYFQISFYLPDTDETIYTSKLIKPGQHIYEITLNKEMEAGEYPLTVRYETFSADEEMASRNGAEVHCTLIVEE